MPTKNLGHRAKNSSQSGEIGKYKESQPRSGYLKQKTLKPGPVRIISVIVSANDQKPSVGKSES